MDLQKNPDLNEIIEWDVKNWHKALEFWKGKNKNEFSSKSVALEIGARNGGLSLWLALQECRVVCSDLSDLEPAKELHQKYNVQHLIEYKIIDATDIPYSNYFDFVIFKSVLGGVGRFDNKAMQVKMISEIYKSLKPGGELLFAENLMASPLHQFFRKRFIRWGSEWRYITIEEMKNFLAKFSYFEYNTTGFLGAFGRNEFQRNILALFDKTFFNFVTPKNWNYILIGIAQK